MEIERRYLLKGLPPIPQEAEVVRIEQGYLPWREPQTIAPADGFGRGRLRRSIDAQGRVACTHNIKEGTGICRHERERVISIEQFEEHWPATVHCRLTKTRYRVDVSGDAKGEATLTWEIDDIDGVDLVLAEVELQSPETKAELPPWLVEFVDREVTDESTYTNYAIAGRLSAGM